MIEENPANYFEQEISQISREIESKRNAIEREYGIIEEKEIAREAIGEKIKDEINLSGKNTSTRSNTHAPVQIRSYLDELDEKSEDKVIELVNLMREKGIKKAISIAREEDPYLLDVFHDILVDKLYDEIKERGYI